jgi:hypothetical protein
MHCLPSPPPPHKKIYEVNAQLLLRLDVALLQLLATRCTFAFSCVAITVRVLHKYVWREITAVPFPVTLMIFSSLGANLFQTL